MPKAPGSSLVIIEISDMASPSAINASLSSLSATHNMPHLNIVIANAGSATLNESLSSTPISNLQRMIDVDAHGTLELFKASASLLRAKPGGKGKFVYISSMSGSLAAMSKIVPMLGYGARKALGKFLVK